MIKSMNGNALALSTLFLHNQHMVSKNISTTLGSKWTLIYLCHPGLISEMQSSRAWVWRVPQYKAAFSKFAGPG